MSACCILDLPNDLLLRIIDTASEGCSSSEKPPAWLRCSMTCKSWRDLIRNRPTWPRVTINLLDEKEEGPQHKEANEQVLRSFESHWRGLQSLSLCQTNEIQKNRPAFTAKQFAELLPKTCQLQDFKILDTKRSSVAIEADCLSWLKNAQHLRSVLFYMHADNIDDHLKHLPPSLTDLQLSGSGLGHSALAPMTSIKALKALDLSIPDNQRTSFTSKDLASIGELPSLEILRISGVALDNIPAWIGEIPKLQELSLSDIVSPEGEPSLTDCPIDLHHLAHLKTVALLSLSRPLPKNIGILKNVKSIKFGTYDRVVDLGVLQACGSKLKKFEVWGWRTFEQGFTTLKAWQNWN